MAQDRQPQMPPFIRLMFLGQLTDETVAEAAAPPKRTLADRVAEDLARLLPTDLDAAPAELPVSRDLSAYDVALAAAVRLCPHEIVHQPLHSRAEVDCLDCGRHLTATEYMRERRERA